MAYQYSVLVGVDFDVADFQKKLQQAAGKVNVQITTTGAKQAEQDLNELNKSAKESAEELGLTWQQAAFIFDTCKEAISAMVTEVFNLDEALIEFQKVSDLSGASLDAYVDKLRDLGDTVARTGLVLGQGVEMVNQHQEPLEIQYNLRAYSATMVA